jgi:sec-independent protein translocase protein TatA
MGALQPWHLILILAIVVLLFGGAKIPELMKGVGKGMGEFKKGLEEGKKPSDEDKSSASTVAVTKDDNTAKS